MTHMTATSIATVIQMIEAKQFEKEREQGLHLV